MRNTVRTAIMLLTVLAMASVDQMCIVSKAAAQQTGGERVKRGPMSGYCPPGTCANNGGRRAMIVSDCKASNCKR
jgi:hypothetical protein